jgi:hypothetical protein
MATRPAGQDFRGFFAPGTVTVPLGSHWNATPFWIILLLFQAERITVRAGGKPIINVADGGGSETARIRHIAVRIL